ncbi:MAG: (Fe-S)-binding protein [Desulfobacteraceae bacterium]|nr:(Fe-S)-binding protein [Desulfobacteraceae bacterium]
MTLDVEKARVERLKILGREESLVLKECVTCYACEEYCPHGNHPFYLIVDRQEQMGIWPVPIPLTKQQLVMMAPRGKITHEKVDAPVVNLCYFPMLKDCVRGKLFEGASSIVGSDIFCNIMWLHFAKNSVIRERVPQMIDNLWDYYLKESGVDEIICFHDECYATYTHLAPAFGIEVPFKAIHLFEYLTKRLDELKEHIRPLGMKVAYQRPCSNRLIPETQHWVDEIFQRIGVERVEREYDRDNALCCGGVIRAQQREELADDLLKRNLDDMKASGANVCVFNCPFCLFTMGEAAAENGLMPLLMSELCQFALGEGKMMGG